MDKKNQLFRYKILPIYWAFLTYILLKPDDGVRGKMWFEFPHLDKIVHIIIFIILGYCYCMAFPRGRFWFFLGIMSLYALITEFLQYWMAMGRTGDVYDFFADMLGVFLGYLIWKKIKYSYH